MAVLFESDMDPFARLPKPLVDEDFYQRTLEEGFRLYPKRKKNYLRFKTAQRGEMLDYLPVRMDVENVSRCNYRCTMCQVSNWPGLKRADDMSLDDFKNMVDSQYGLTEIKLQGMGEPTMGKCFVEMIEYARSKSIWVRSTTNASMLHLRNNYQRIIDADICELQVSVDGATSDVYEKIRKGGKFKRVTENCRLLNQYCRDVGRMRTRMWVVVQRDNMHQLELFAPLAAELGFDQVNFSLDLNDWGQERWRDANNLVDVHRELDPSYLETLIAPGQKHGIEVTFWVVDEKYDTSHPDRICSWPFERGYVSSDMRLAPCCLIANPEVSDLGDARQLTQTWNGEKMAAFRRQHLQGNLPEFCLSCYKNPASAN